MEQLMLMKGVGQKSTKRIGSFAIGKLTKCYCKVIEVRRFECGR